MTQTNNTIDEIFYWINDQIDDGYYKLDKAEIAAVKSQLKQVILDEVIGRNQAESDMPDNKVLLTGKQIIENDLRAKQRTIVEELFK